VKKPRNFGLILLPETDLHNTYIDLNLVRDVVVMIKIEKDAIQGN